MKRFKLFLLSTIIATSSMYAVDLYPESTYKISNADDVLCVENASLNDGARVSIWTDTDVNAQRWVLKNNANGEYILCNAYSDNYLTNSGTSLSQTNEYSAAATWEIERVDGSNNLFYIKNTDNGLYLEALATTPKQVSLYAKKSGPALVNQQWSLEQEDSMPNYLTADYRDQMMEGWKNRYYSESSSRARIGEGGFWSDAEMFESILDAYETTGQAQYMSMFKKLHADFLDRQGSDWRSNDFNDDIAWIVIASLRGYLMTGTQNYLTVAQRNFDMMYERAAVLPEGTLVWNAALNQRGTNSCINGPAAVAACYLAVATGDDSYYEIAKNIYAAQRKYLYVPSTGQVYDCFTWDGNNPTNYNTWSSTYNQGTFLGAAIMLYNHYKEEQYAHDAKTIMRYTRTHLCDDNDIINVCQGVVNSDGNSLVGDLPGFKGVLMRYVRRFMVDFYQPDCKEWIADNAYQAYNNRNSEGVSCTAWLTKTDEEYTSKAPYTNYNSDPFGPSTAVSAAFNTYINKTIRKDAFVDIQAENFDYIKGIYTEESEGVSTPIMGGDILANAYTGYHNVNFGSSYATAIDMVVKPMRSGSVVSVHLGSPDGEILATTDLPTEQEWQVVRLNLSKAIDGTQSIYLKYTRSTGAALLQIDSFKFVKGDEASTTSDVTDNMGRITTSMSITEGSSIESIIDNHATTAFVATYTDNSWIQYASPYPVILKGYRLVAAEESAASTPSAWELQASHDGDNWTTIDTQTNQSLVSSYSQLQYDINTTTAYNYFRLSIKERQGSEATIQLGDWQIFGAALADFSILSDGGLFELTHNQDIDNLIDNDITTNYIVDNANFDITYQPTSPYNISGYNISTSDNSLSDPTSWNVYASEDGKKWDLLDTQNNQSFPYRNATYTYLISSISSTDDNLVYKYYKIAVTANNGASTTQIAEWQLLGDFIPHTYYNDITSNGGALASATTDSYNSNSTLINLTDNDGSTYYTFNSENPWIEYWSPYPVTLSSLALVLSYNMDDLPTNILVEYMNEGDKSYRRAYYGNLEFSSRNERIHIACTRNVTGNRFRITLNNPATLSEIELYGLSIQSDDLTKGAVIAAQYESDVANEKSASLIDKSYTTKYCAEFPLSTWITCTLTKPVLINSYTLTSANDSPLRDPRAWVLEASNDGVAWTTIDERTEQTFVDRYRTQFYSCDSNESYSHYRLLVSENNGEGILQMAEWQLLYAEPVVTSVESVEKTQIIASARWSNGALHVQTIDPARVILYSLQGIALYNIRVENGTSILPLQLTEGIYIAKVIVNNQVVTQKLLVQ